MISQAELDAAYKAAREAIRKQSLLYSNMIADDVLQSIIAPAYRAGITIREKDKK